MTRATRDVIAVHWLCERVAGLLQWAAIAAALVGVVLGVLRLAGLALARAAGLAGGGA